MDPRESAHAIPGCLGWMFIAAVFVLTGEWINSVGGARNHPVLIAILALALVGSAAWRATLGERWLPAFLAMLLVNVISTAFIFGLILMIDDVQMYPFTVFGRSFGLGRLIVVGAPLLFVLAMVCSTVGFGIYGLVDTIRRRR